jgi:phosphoribosylanthranilate isomerase
MSTRVKICGLTNLADAQSAVDAGADFLGFILYPKSPRYVAPATVAQIIQTLQLPTRLPQTVGVFVNTPVAEIIHLLETTGLDLAQLHGDESEADLAQLAGRGYKAVRPADAACAPAALPFTAYPNATTPHLLIDAYHPTLYGGTGHLGDWAVAEALRQTVPRLVLAGGLTPENVPYAIAAVQPWGVDVAGGVEVAPGRKDHVKVRDFVTAVRRA